MPNITQAELQQLVRHDTRRITETKQTVIRKDRAQTHRPSMQQAFMAEVAQTSMAMHDLYLLSNEDLSQHWKG
jgi:hypothetical protein